MNYFGSNRSCNKHLHKTNSLSVSKIKEVVSYCGEGGMVVVHVSFTGNK